MFHVVTPDTMMLSLRTILCGGRVQLSIGMIAYLDLAKPNLSDLLPCAALDAFRRETSWLRHLESPLPTQGSQCSIFGLAYAPENAAPGAWKVRAAVGPLRASSALANTGISSHPRNHSNVHGVGPIRLSAKSVNQGRIPHAASELIGNESITIHHMHPQQAILRGKLPGLRARCFVKMRDGSQNVIRKLDSTLDKLWLFPNNQTGVVRYRALMPLDIVGGTFDIERLVAGWETIDAPTTSAHFYIDLLNGSKTEGSKTEVSQANGHHTDGAHVNARRTGGTGAIPPDWVESRCWHAGGAPKAAPRKSSPANRINDAPNRTSGCLPERG